MRNFFHSSNVRRTRNTGTTNKGKKKGARHVEKATSRAHYSNARAFARRSDDRDGVGRRSGVRIGSFRSADPRYAVRRRVDQEGHRPATRQGGRSGRTLYSPVQGGQGPGGPAGSDTSLARRDARGLRPC